jgi:hypothetical protein
VLLLHPEPDNDMAIITAGRMMRLIIDQKFIG